MKITMLNGTLIDTDPKHRPPVKGNQATYLFFPVLASFALVLIANLALPVIKGLTVVNVRMGDEAGTSLAFGHWGWCVHSANSTIDGKCFANSAMGDYSDMAEVAALPLEVQGQHLLSLAVPKSYQVANVAFHIIAAIVCWITLIWTLAASGEWQNQRQDAYSWTKWSFTGTFWSAVLILIPWALDLAMVDRLSLAAKQIAGDKAKATHGGEIWLLMSAFVLNLVTFAARVSYLKYKPRPLWTVKGQEGDFHSANPPPMSAALPPQDDQPPTWESLQANAVIGYSAEHGPAATGDIKEAPSVEERGFIV